MIRNAKRPMPAADLLTSIMIGKEVPEVYDIKESMVHPGIRNVVLTATRKRVAIGMSPLAKGQTIGNCCDPRPSPPCCKSGVPITQWIESTLYADRGVIAALPATGSSPSRTVALDQRAASGHAEYWIVNMANNASMFNASKTSTSLSSNSVTYESITLHSKVPEFLPEGDVFGAAVADTDCLIDAGFKMQVRMDPYISSSEVVSLRTDERQLGACCTELALQFAAAERGIAPAVLACFFSQSDDLKAAVDDDGEIKQKWLMYTTPKQTVDGRLISPKEPTGIRSMVTVNQISTFSLDDLMSAIRSAPVQSRKEHLVGVMKSMCGPIFQKIKEISSVHNGYGMVKLNMTPSSVVFCPDLKATDDGSWTLEGSGYMPISDSYIDGTPRIVDYNSMFTARVREAAHSFETSYAMGCMLLIAFSRAQHGASVADVLWQHLTAEDDPSGFVGAVRSIGSRSTNTSAFLACVVANTDMRELPEVSKALAGVVSDIDAIVRETIVNSDGSLRRGSDAPVFAKLVSLVTGSSDVDTRIFAPLSAGTGGQDFDDDMEADDIRALQRVKALRLERLAVVTA